MALVRLIHEVSDGENWVHIWNGSNSEAERAVRDPRVDFLSFTGSARVGWKLHGLVPRRPAILEHGGDAFVIVDRGTDLVDAAERVHRSAFGYAGQVCISAQHALVEASLLDDFLIELRRVDATRPNWLAPMINESAAVRVEELVTEALSAGAKLELGGERQRNRFSPTVLANVPCTTRVYSEEVFGPVLTCASFSSTDEVVTRILQSPNALQLGVFTHDQRLVDRLVHDVAHPGIIVNETPSFRFDHMPYGGEKLSGLGREGVFEAMRALCVTKSVVKRG
jgi:acyl-CoA reductase-like NAD-dependent aldehyde dehydrogenase